jgi:hypothetical protein
VDASCNCGAPLVPVVKVKDHFDKNPGDTRSNRAIAAELGVSEGTVRNGKKSGAQPYAPDPDERPTIDNPPKGAPWDDQDDRDEEDQTVEKRVIGKDGKSYPATKPPVKKKNYP